MKRKKTITCLIRRDIKNSMLCNKRKMLCYILLMLLFCIYVSGRCGDALEQGLISGRPTTADLILYLYRGMWEYNPSINPVFEIPIAWLSIQLFLGFMIGSYAYDDFDGFGMQFLIRSEMKTYWYIGKCCYCFFTVFLYYLIGYLTILFFSMIKGQLSFDISPDIGGILSEVDTSLITEHGFVIHLILLPFITSLVISIFQMLFSLYIKPILSYSFVIVYLVLSAYWVKPYFIGNFSMILRFAPFKAEGLDMTKAMITDGILLAAVILFGCFHVKHLDFIKKEQGHKIL